MNPVLCPYCDMLACLVSGEDIYPHRPELAAKLFWQCKPCRAYVGCHPKTETPLGRLANAELRKAKMAAHDAFDPKWKSGVMKRKAAYFWLSKQMHMAFADCHIGMFDVEQCKQVVEICRTVAVS